MLQKGTDRKRLIASVVVICFFIGIFLFLIVGSGIGYGVKDVCRQAQGKYDGDCVSALVQYVEDDANSLEDRNMAVWALGQLGDERALPALEKFFTGYEEGTKCNHEKELCQYELRKAIALINDGFNVTAYVWRD